MAQLKKHLHLGAVRLDRDRLQFLATLLDPRGRCNRRGLFVLALALLGAQFAAGILLAVAGFGIDSLMGMFVAALFLWVGYTAVSKRLHDVGLSAWWFLATIAFWLAGVMVLSFTFGFLLGADAMAQGSPAYAALFALTMLPLFAAMLWLHMRTGETEANRFGPVPDRSGFAMPREPARAMSIGAAVLA